MTLRDDPRHNLRLTPGLKKRLTLAAVENGRSLNAEIIVRLEQSFSAEVKLAELRGLLKEVLERLEKLGGGPFIS